MPHVRDEHNWIICYLDEESSTPLNVDSFTSHWRPSLNGPGNLVPPDCQWIAINRGRSYDPRPQRINELNAAFKTLSRSHLRDGNITLTVSVLDQLACQYNVKSGKWMIFADLDTVDSVWADVVRLVCLHRRRGLAKVSANREATDRVICVYVDDFTDVKEVKKLRQDLRMIGVERKIAFKMDAYTHMGIYQGNVWEISPTRYYE
ncbi:translation initiation factor eIF 4e-like domain-containing protein [Lentinula detonsa]|uniref:Translation initiation factor eIF 4e-like domain-containing protein n=1 Tax=Lentinula detonsa TaxID=2804962 RepID=A0AA38UPZ0_9AGAR|nr:translation initiation factor eIF 4e-like domain-containing protein [Lentinula detonsa]